MITRNELMPIYLAIYRIAAAIIAMGQEHAPMLQLFRLGDDDVSVPLGMRLLDMSDKDSVAKLLRRARVECGPRDVAVFINEAWVAVTAKDADLAAIMALPPRERPGAHEAVTFTFFGDGFEWWASCRIRRPDNTLEWMELEDGAANMGRFAMTLAKVRG